MKEQTKEVLRCRKELRRRVQKLSRSNRRGWNEVKRLLPKTYLGDMARNDRLMVYKEKHRDGNRRVFVNLKTGTLSGDEGLILSIPVECLDPERTIHTLRELIRQSQTKTPL